jgi:hypothetical protein
MVLQHTALRVRFALCLHDHIVDVLHVPLKVRLVAEFARANGARGFARVHVKVPEARVAQGEFVAAGTAHVKAVPVNDLKLCRRAYHF